VISVRGAEAVSVGTEWLIRTWQTEDGLPENSATAMVQGPDGYLWFGTFNGLVQFNGIDFKVFNSANTPGLPDGGIVNLHLDRRGRMWVSTYGGLAVRGGDRWETLGKPGEFVRTFSERKNGDLLITLFDGGVLEFSNDTLKRLPDPPGEKNKGYFGHVDEAGNWSVIQHRFIGQWDGTRWVQMLPSPDLPPDKVGCAAARGGGLWIFQGTELRHYRDGVEDKKLPVTQFAGGLWSFSEDSYGNIWLCTPENGLYQVTPVGETRHWTLTNGLSSMAVRFVFEDREKNLWVGTTGGGLMRWNQKHFQTFGKESVLIESPIHSISPSKEEGIWIATYGNGLFRLDEKGVRPVSIAEPKDSWRFAQSVLEDHSGRVWLGTLGNGGLFRLDGDKVERFDTSLTGGGNVVALYEDSRGQIWMGGGQMGTAVYDGTKFQLLGERENGPKGDVRCFQEDAEGAIWVSNLNGVYRFRNGAFEEVRLGSQPLEAISCFKTGTDGTMWMGSLNKGLLQWKGGQLSVFDEKAGFSVNTVYAIEKDGQGFLWITSNRGVVRMHEHDLDALAGAPGARLKYQQFDVADGLPTLQCSNGQQPLLGCDSNGVLWLATIKGVEAINTRHFQANDSLPITHVEELSYHSGRGSKEEQTRITGPFAQRQVLQPGSHLIEFKYNGLSFAAPERVRYQIKLEGENEEWENAGERRVASYHDLKPGEYVFRVRAESKAGAMDETGASLAFTLLPFFWQTMWFRVAVAGVLLALGWGTARWRFKTTEAMFESAKRMVLAADVAALGMWEWNIVTDQVRMTKKCAEIFSFPPEAVTNYEALLSRVHPTDRALVSDCVESALEKGAYHITHRLQLPDQSLRWIAASGIVDFDRKKKPVRFVGMCMDISERHQAEEAAQKLSGRLIHAQEDERRRIARDLHDDLNQRLALLSVEMELLGHNPNDPNARPDPRLAQVASQIRELSSEVHKLSYQLHPAKLDQLGLISAARSLCRELTQQSKVKIEFLQHQVPREIPAEIALCLYRVMQESLQNIVRHSRAREARVQLRFDNDHLKLSITDSGTGFNLEGIRQTAGLGLISMEERVRLIHGKITIDSRPGLGTEISVDVPWSTSTPFLSSRALS